MVARTALKFILIISVLVCAGTATSLGQESIQKHFNEAAKKVKATSDPSEKREILNNELQNMSKALDRVRNSPFVSETDLAGIDRFQAALQESQNELAGTNGYTRVSDDQLNAFSNYVVQNAEQAEKTITIGLVAALLIVIILILLV